MSKLKKAELLAIAEKHEIEIAEDATKSDIIEALEAEEIEWDTSASIPTDDEEEEEEEEEYEDEELNCRGNPISATQADRQADVKRYHRVD